MSLSTNNYKKLGLSFIPSAFDGAGIDTKPHPNSRIREYKFDVINLGTLKNIIPTAVLRKTLYNDILFSRKKQNAFENIIIKNDQKIYETISELAFNFYGDYSYFAPYKIRFETLNSNFFKPFLESRETHLKSIDRNLPFSRVQFPANLSNTTSLTGARLNYQPTTIQNNVITSGYYISGYNSGINYSNRNTFLYKKYDNVSGYLPYPNSVTLWQYPTFNLNTVIALDSVYTYPEMYRDMRGLLVASLRSPNGTEKIVYVSPHSVQNRFVNTIIDNLDLRLSRIQPKVVGRPPRYEYVQINSGVNVNILDIGSEYLPSGQNVFYTGVVLDSVPGGFIASGAGMGGFDGRYVRSGTRFGKPMYIKESNPIFKIKYGGNYEYMGTGLFVNEWVIAPDGEPDNFYFLPQNLEANQLSTGRWLTTGPGAGTPPPPKLTPFNDGPRSYIIQDILKQTTPLKDTWFYKFYSGLYTNNKTLATGTWDGTIPSGHSITLEYITTKDGRMGTNNEFRFFYKNYGDNSYIDQTIKNTFKNPFVIKTGISQLNPQEGVIITDPITGRTFIVGQPITFDLNTTEAYSRAIEAWRVANGSSFAISQPVLKRGFGMSYNFRNSIELSNNNLRKNINNSYLQLRKNLPSGVSIFVENSKTKRFRNLYSTNVYDYETLESIPSGAYGCFKLANKQVICIDPPKNQ